MRILVVDDDAVCRLSLEVMIRLLGHDCQTAADGREAWRILQAEQIDVLITDREMPFIDGLELCRLVRTQLPSGHVYVMLATGYGTLEEARAGMSAGADDYLVKPTQLEDVELRLIAAERVNALHRSLSLVNQELRTVARRDSVSGLGNRRCLAEDLVVMEDRHRRYGQRFAVALLGVDHFKSYTDGYGSEQGDATLKVLADALKHDSRAGDVCYRYSPETFLWLLPEQTSAGAVSAVERRRASIAELAIPHSGGIGGVLTVSAGIAELNEWQPDANEAVRAADMALYEAKRHGLNRVEVAGSWVPQPRISPSNAQPPALKPMR